MKRAERGFTMAEMLMVVAIICVGVLAFALALTAKPSLARASLAAFAGAYEHTRALARASSDGATLELLVDGTGTQMVACSGRPDHGLTDCHTQEISGSAISAVGPTGTLYASPFNVYVNGDGSVAVDSNPGSAVEPACASGKVITIDVDGQVYTSPTIACDDGSLSGMPK